MSGLFMVTLLVLCQQQAGASPPIPSPTPLSQTTVGPTAPSASPIPPRKLGDAQVLSPLPSSSPAQPPAPSRTASPSPLASPTSAPHSFTVQPAVSGSLSERTSAAPAVAVTLNGTDQTANYSLPITVADSRTSAVGWNLTITSTTFSGGGHTLPTAASTITASTAVCSGSCTLPTNAITYPQALPAGSTAPTAVKFFNAAAGTGKLTMTVTPVVKVTVPGNAFAGTYTSTLTIAIVSGP